MASYLVGFTPNKKGDKPIESTTVDIDSEVFTVDIKEDIERKVDGQIFCFSKFRDE